MLFKKTKVPMTISEIAEKLTYIFKFPKAEKYDLYLRDYDDHVEVLGYIPDPNYDINDFVGREMLFPKRWVTLGTVSSQIGVQQ